MARGHADLPRNTPAVVLQKRAIFDALKRIDNDPQARARATLQSRRLNPGPARIDRLARSYHPGHQHRVPCIPQPRQNATPATAT